MITNQAVEELASWAATIKQWRRDEARGHLQQFRHLGASLVASKEFQNHFQEEHDCRIEPAEFECLCKFLATIAEVEAGEIERRLPESGDSPREAGS